MLNKKNRISNRQLISKLLSSGKVYQTDSFTIKYLPSHFADSEFAIITSKKISTKAIVRNKLRRQISESLRLNLNLLKNPLVAVIITKSSILNKEYQDIEAKIQEFLNTTN